METEQSEGHTLTDDTAPGADTAGSTVSPTSFVGPAHGDSPESSIDRVDQLLDEVERALTRLDDGSYGRCQVCGSLIDDARLAALPTVQTCGTCSDPGDDDVSRPAATDVAVGHPTGSEPDGPPLDD